MSRDVNKEHERGRRRIERTCKENSARWPRLFSMSKRDQETDRQTDRQTDKKKICRLEERSEVHELAQQRHLALVPVLAFAFINCNTVFVRYAMMMYRRTWKASSTSGSVSVTRHREYGSIPKSPHLLLVGIAVPANARGDWEPTPYKESVVVAGLLRSHGKPGCISCWRTWRKRIGSWRSC